MKDFCHLSRRHKSVLLSKTTWLRNQNFLCKLKSRKSRLSKWRHKRSRLTRKPKSVLQNDASLWKVMYEAMKNLGSVWTCSKQWRANSSALIPTNKLTKFCRKRFQFQRKTSVGTIFMQLVTWIVASLQMSPLRNLTTMMVTMKTYSKIRMMVSRKRFNQKVYLRTSRAFILMQFWLRLAKKTNVSSVQTTHIRLCGMFMY